MAIRDTYRFIITTPNGQFIANPDNPQLQWKWEKHPDEDFFIKQLSSELRFINQSVLNIYDFDKLHQVERGGHLCDRTEITVEKKCKTGGWTHWFDGFIALVDGKWNVEKCTVNIRPRSLDSLACLTDHWKDEHNLVDLAPFEHISRVEGEIEEVECCTEITGYPDDYVNLTTGDVTYPISTACITGSSWNVLRNEMSFRNYGRWRDPLRGKWTICTTHIREKWVGSVPPTSDGWEMDGGDYVRPLPTVLIDKLANIKTLESGKFDNIEFFQQYSRLADLEYGLSFNKIITELINQRCGFDIVSNFFGINPDATNPTNIAYDFALAHLQELYIADIQSLRIDISEGPVALNYSFEDIWKDVKRLFNLSMRMSNGKLYIEHVSYFKNRFMLDMTKPNLVKHLKGKYEYEYIKEELPRFEKWEYVYEPDGYFRPLKVEYKGDCVTDDEDKEKVYPIENFVVDIDGVILSQGEDEVEVYPERMLALVATNGGGLVKYPVTAGGHVETNGMLTWPVLFDALHKWGRKKKTGIVTKYPDDPGVNTEFFGRPKNRIQKDIMLPVCCEDIDSFAPEDYVKTQLGWGAVDSATYDAPSEILTFNLRHD